jgi:hypothetical protein
VHGRREVVESQIRFSSYPGDPVRGGGFVLDACAVDKKDPEVEERLRASVGQR